MARYLITGAAGFIGSSLAHELVRLGHQVLGIDNLSDGNLANLESIRKQVEFRRIDLLDREQLKHTCRGVDYVLHLAAIASVPKSIQDPAASHAANVDGTLNLLLAARDAGVARVIFAASSSAYGDQPTQPKEEQMLPCPLSPYAVQKLACEHYMQSFWHVYGLETVCLRYFNVFGPRQSAASSYSGVIARFISDMLKGIPPTIFGTGKQSRDFTFISNVISANLLAMAAPSELVAGAIYNIGTGSSQSLNTLYSELSRLLEFPLPPVFAPARLGDIEHSRADITRAECALGYTPICGFSEGLRLTVEWYLAEQPAHARILV